MTGVVLAGGDSRRMGRDKAVLEFEGCRLVDRAVAALQTVCAEVFVAAGARTIPDLDIRAVADEAGAVGPLAGIVGALRHARTPLLAVAAVDLPFIDPPLLDSLARRWRDEAAVVPRVDGLLQPLHAVYSVAAAPDFLRLLQAGERSPTAAVQRLAAAVVDVADGGFAVNLNAPQDLAALGTAPPEPTELR